MIYEKLGDQEIAKDLTIEALGKAFKNLHKYTPNFAFSTWLFAVAKNHCIDYLRKRKIDTISIDDFIESNDGRYSTLKLKSDDPNPESIIIKKQRISILRQIVDQLKPKYRDLVKLRYFKEMSYEEVSEQLGIPLGTCLLYTSPSPRD